MAQPTPIASPTKRDSMRIRQRLFWVKGRTDNMVSSNQNRGQPLSSGEVEGLTWCGLRTIHLRKNLQGFGFTLRHFILYPPESSIHNFKDGENGNAVQTWGQASHLEPMDTIFVKSVKENGPAYHAGLCRGDRLVKVNGENILGKTYSQVIALIQNSETSLELSVMQKDEDVLQLAHSQDVYLRGNQAYSGKAQSLPEPLLPYSSTNPNSIAVQPRHKLSGHLDNCECRSSPTTSLLDKHPTIASSGDSCDNIATSVRHLGRSSSTISALNFHFANHNAAITSATLPPPRKSRLRVSGHLHTDSLCHQALSDWYNCQAEVAEHLTTHNCSTSQDHLSDLGLSAGPPVFYSAQTKQIETLLYHHQTSAASHDSYWLGGCSRPGSRSCSETLLSAYAEYERNYGRSVETLEKASAVIPPSSDQITIFSQQRDHKAKGKCEHQTKETSLSSTVSPCGMLSGQQVAEPQTRRLTEEVVGCKSNSLSLSHKTSHLLQHVQALQKPYNSDPHFSCSPEIRSSAAANKVRILTRPQSIPNQPASETQAHTGHERDVISPIALNQEVVLKQKRPSASTLSPQSPESLSETASPVSAGPGASRGAKSSLAQQVYDSLSSIPFIGRRSSYLLAITTERSKSCDEGLNTFREEGHVFPRLPKRVKSFFIDGSFESLKAQEEARSKRHSTSELETITLSIRKEGWLYYKQILTEKGKKVGGGMRPWKHVFSVLRSYWLFLYKDKREAVLHGAGASPGQDEYPPVSIRGCLIDIAYSETKRKHTLRLTTQDFCEYLFQAENRDDMLAWIKLIRENSKIDNEEIGSSRQALINKKLNDYRKQSLTGNKPDSSAGNHRLIPPFLLADNPSVNRSSKTDDNKAPWGINIMKKSKKRSSSKAFGVRLEDCQPAVNHKFVPLIVEMCCGVVEATGLDYTGIYRVPGNNAMVSSLQEHLNKGFDLNTAKERWQDLNVISSLLKSFFRKLPEPLFTDDKYHDFIDASRMEVTSDRLTTMKKLIHELPDHHHHTLKFLVAHLKRVADHSEKNKMEPRNLALVFGPTLVRTSEDNMTDMVTHMPDRYKIVETLILHCGWFFSEEELDKQEKPPDDKQGVQPNIDHLLCNIGKLGMPGGASDSTISDSVRSKISLSAVTDLNLRDILSESIISAVTHKRKKCPTTLWPRSCSDEDCEHEPVKASNCVGEGGGSGKEEVARETEIFHRKHYVSTHDNMSINGNGVKAREIILGKECGGKRADEEGGPDIFTKNQRGCRLEPQLCPNSFLCKYPQINSTSPRPSPFTRPHNFTGKPTTPPLCVLSTKLTDLCQAFKNYQPAASLWPQPVPLHKRRGGRTKAVSMNFDLELNWQDEKVRQLRADRVEVITVHDKASGHRKYVPHGIVSHVDAVPRVDLEESCYSWVDQDCPVSSDLEEEEAWKWRAWRRHTVVV
ncbi:rho GTPase-activating protein 21-like isoform X2 [Dunckerocampus dactyliophorus]|uniref:rho GTPase-activating protein 21-like isoform X2 n=1 Tax=Dunckerocampus dactyliophorus TaxID=161453 RepID=UPI002406704F|nr:rho GTPase-activating protein 21-like isoform X2 [Dunckerocampus dactyliophorus]